MIADLSAARDAPPLSAKHLRSWIYAYTGLRIASRPVCEGHSTPIDMLWEVFINRPPLMLWHGARGAGKSFLAGLDMHLTSRYNPRHKGTILGGSAQQSKQIYNTLREFVKQGRGPAGSDGDSIAKLLEQSTHYRNGSLVTLLAASPRAVRGPHVATLKLDEVDEIPEDLRQDAVGMAMEQNGVSASIHMMSTWHRTDGPMRTLIEQSNAGEFPRRIFCAFDVLEFCPPSRSGPWVGGADAYAGCPSCVVRPWCHADRHRFAGRPKAKRGDGHYTIDTLIQKVWAVSRARFEADYLCGEPKPEGAIFPDWGSANVTDLAEFDPALPVWLAIDTGVRTGAVWFQIVPGPRPIIKVFADYYSEGLGAEANAKAIIEICNRRCLGRRDRVLTDPAGGHRNPVGPIVINEYKNAGLTNIKPWIIRGVQDGIELVRSFVRAADGFVGLWVHTRCEHTISAFRHYSRKKVRGVYRDEPEDPQHPHENLIDPLRCGLVQNWPRGREQVPAGLVKVPFHHVF